MQHTILTRDDFDMDEVWAEPIHFTHRDHTVTLEIVDELEHDGDVVSHLLIISVDERPIHYGEHPHFEELIRWTWGEISDEWAFDIVISVVDEHINSLVRH